MNTLVQRLTGPELMGRLADRQVLKSSDPDPALAPPAGTANAREYVAESIEKMIATELRRGTHLIDLAVYHPDRDRAKQLAASLIDEFQALSDEQRIA